MTMRDKRTTTVIQRRTGVIMRSFRERECGVIKPDEENGPFSCEYMFRFEDVEGKLGKLNSGVNVSFQVKKIREK